LIDTMALSKFILKIEKKYKSYPKDYLKPIREFDCVKFAQEKVVFVLLTTDMPSNEKTVVTKNCANLDPAGLRLEIGCISITKL